VADLVRRRFIAKRETEETRKRGKWERKRQSRASERQEKRMTEEK